mgnify:CR=1 FL=1
MNARLVMKQYSEKNFESSRKIEKEKLNFGYQSTYITLMGLIVFLLLYYVWILNANATKGYTIRQLEETQKELAVELDRLNVKIAELDSLETMSSDELFQDMVPIEDPNYLVLKENVQFAFKD